MRDCCFQRVKKRDETTVFLIRLLLYSNMVLKRLTACQYTPVQAFRAGFSVLETPIFGAWRRFDYSASAYLSCHHSFKQSGLQQSWAYPCGREHVCCRTTPRRKWQTPCRRCTASLRTTTEVVIRGVFSNPGGANLYFDMAVPNDRLPCASARNNTETNRLSQICCDTEILLTC